ncbi:MAG: M23 family metallopeptidase [Phenylobacterium sp.]|uniref:M23 family metallopeptidase n=1 Tax=Phenylobacterium sp. TaxID=1871053 RepID=UPI001B46D081|nr:M23 family metallopeptidase [Phenylobacterium sp.]MBP7817422.1 M23 family metallopeptidase [Phenylobacterium sp.]MBP9753885.1 M23 family metallopeptidase [Phenylobacterium sp.]
MRAPLIFLILIILAVLALVGYNSGWFGTPATGPGPTSAGDILPGAPVSGGPGAESDEPVGDGGLEQLPDEPQGQTPVDPVDTPDVPAAGTFGHFPAGELLPKSGSGYLDRTTWSPQLCFPFAEDAFANSQVYGPGGGMGPKDKPSQCDATNYSLPWRDNFCESRGHASPLCANGKGHQGQDIRPATCKKDKHWVVAAEDGIITDMGTYTVTLTGSAPPHRVYRYLHMRMNQLAVTEGAVVKAGDNLGKASNDFGGTPTTIHMHFEIRAGVAGTSTDGKAVKLHTFLPPYQSLVAAYDRKRAGQACQ